MPCTVVEGPPGGGKSLHAVGEFILPAVKSRRMVVTNIPLNQQALDNACGFDTRPFVTILEEGWDDENAQPIKPFSKVEHWEQHKDWRDKSSEGAGRGPMYVVDECHEVLQVPGYVNKADHAVANFVARHRHHGVELVLVTQKFDQIPASIRARVDVRFRYTKASALGLQRSTLKTTYVGQSTKPSGAPSIRRYNKEWYALYNSTVLGVLESLPRTPNLLNSWFLWFALTGAVLGLGWLAWNGGLHVPGSGPSKASDKARAQAGAPQSNAATQSSDAPSSGAKPAEPTTSVRLRELREQIELAKAESELASIQSGQGQGGSALSSIGGGQQSAQIVPNLAVAKQVSDAHSQIQLLNAQYALQRLKEARPKQHPLDGAKVKISGYLSLDARPTYYLDVLDRGATAIRTVKSNDLEMYGFTVMAVDKCMAWLKGDAGNYRLSCDEPATLGVAIDENLAGKLKAAQSVKPMMSIGHIAN